MVGEGIGITLTILAVLLPAGMSTAQASGINLLLNSSFEEELDRWGDWEENPETADVEVTQQEADVHEGSKAWKAGGH